jgi:hypothetical protein
MEIDADLEAVQTLLSFSRAAARQQQEATALSSMGSSDESQDQWASSDDSIDHLQSAKVNPPFFLKKEKNSTKFNIPLTKTSIEIDGLHATKDSESNKSRQRHIDARLGHHDWQKGRNCRTGSTAAATTTPRI